MFSGNWSAKFEYLHYDLGSARYTGIVNNFANANVGGFLAYSVSTLSSTRFSGDIVRVGLNYKLWGGPAFSR